MKKVSGSTGVVLRATFVCTVILTIAFLFVPAQCAWADKDQPAATPAAPTPPAEPGAPPSAPTEPGTTPPVQAPAATTAPAAEPVSQVATAAGETRKLEPTIVTGSLIPTAETVGASPVSTVTAADIETSATPGVLSLLKRLDSSFSGAGNIGETLNNGGFGESYVAIRNLPSLVLINGHRLGNSSFSNGSLVDLNTIPMAAIERIEVLKDGASALYGSDAIGGVVNVITKKDYSGIETFTRYGGATGDGNYFEQTASIVGGITTEKAHFLAAAQYYNSNPLYTTDRGSVAGLSAKQLYNRGIEATSVSYNSPSFPGKVQGGGTWYLDQTHYQTPPVFPGQSFNTVADYNAYATDPLGGNLAFAPYGTTPPDFAQAPYGILNTTKFGTISVQSQNRKQFFGEGTFDIVDKQLQVFGEFLYANLHSQGELAPSPVIGLASFQSNISIPANNPYNPFGINLGPDYGAAGLPPTAPRIRSRFWDSGNRIFDQTTDYYHFVGGLKGSFDNGYTYEGSYTYNNYDQEAKTENAINGSALGYALTPNIDPTLAAQGLSQLRGPGGTYVPVYNMFSYPGQNSKDTLQAISTTLYNSGRSESWSAGGNITGTPFELPAGDVGVAVGGGFGTSSLWIDFDGLTRQGKVPGLNASEPTSGSQDSYNLYIETRIPITSPDNDIPAFHSFEVTAAGRFDSYNPGGDYAVPKVGIRWQPLDEQVTLRATYSQSFLAPSTYQLYGGDQQSNPVLTVADGTFQETVVFAQNSNLKASNAENYGFGAVVSPKIIKGLTVSVDYYHVRQWNAIYRLDGQSMVDNMNQFGSASPYAQYYTFADGSKLTTTAPNQLVDTTWGSLDTPLANGATINTDGLDLTLAYEIPTDQYGKWTFYCNANYLFSFDYQDPTIGGPYVYAGQYTDVQVVGGAQGALPRYQVNTGLTWEIEDFTYTVNARYIPEMTDKGDSFPYDGQNFNNPNAQYFNFYTVNGKNWTVDSWYSIDMQLAYEVGKTKVNKSWYDGFTVAVGCNNVTAQDPPLISSSSEYMTDKATYDIIGRFIYFQMAKKF